MCASSCGGAVLVRGDIVIAGLRIVLCELFKGIDGHQMACADIAVDAVIEELLVQDIRQLLVCQAVYGSQVIDGIIGACWHAGWGWLSMQWASIHRHWGIKVEYFWKIQEEKRLYKKDAIKHVYIPEGWRKKKLPSVIGNPIDMFKNSFCIIQVLVGWYTVDPWITHGAIESGCYNIDYCHLPLIFPTHTYTPATAATSHLLHVQYTPALHLKRLVNHPGFNPHYLSKWSKVVNMSMLNKAIYIFIYMFEADIPLCWETESKWVLSFLKRLCVCATGFCMASVTSPLVQLSSILSNSYLHCAEDRFWSSHWYGCNSLDILLMQ